MNAAQFILSLIPTGGRAEINGDTLHYEIIDIASGACRLKVNDGEYEDINFNALPGELKHKLELDSITHGLDSKKRDAQELTLKQRSAIRAWYERDAKRNQESIAELFISLNTGRVCYSYELRRWLIYNGKYWEIDNANVKIEGALIAFNKDVIEVIGEDKQNWRDTAPEAKRKESFYTWAIRLNDRPALDNVLSIAANKCAVSLTEFDIHDLLYNVNNGTINLKTGKLRAHSPDDKITLICDVNYYKNAKYDEWDNTLKDACERPEYIRYLQREFGYCLTGLTNEEFLPILLGEPLTGKSTFYESIMEVFGDYGHYMNFSTLKHSDKDGGAPREDILRLRTARLVMCSEINPKTVFDTALVKKITSGEKLVARGIRARDSVEFTPKFKVCIGTNYSPIIPYDDGGTYRRCKVNPFKNVVSLDKIDKELKIRFKEDKAARERILSWLVEGCLLWKREGLDTEPREVMRANSEYRRSQNPISLFLEDYCVEDRKSDEKTKGTTVKEFVDTFNYHRGEYGAEAISSKSFGRYMKALSYESYRVADKRGYKSIRLKTQKEIDADVDFNDIEEGYKRANEKKEAIGALYELIRCDEKYTHLMTYDVYNAILPYISINIPNQCVFRVNAKNEDLNVIRHKPSNSVTSSNVDQSKLAGYVIDVLRDIKNAGANLAIKDLDDFVKSVSARVKMLHHEYQHYDVEKFTRRLTTEDKTAQGLLADIVRGGKKATSATEAKRHSSFC